MADRDGGPASAPAAPEAAGGRDEEASANTRDVGVLDPVLRAVTESVLPPGQRFGRFEIEAAAASGGMGSVYRARDTDTGALVAVKVLRHAARDAARFARETKLLAALSHPGIVRHVAHGVTDEGQLYLVMEWLEGEDLSARLARGVLDVAETLELGLRVAGALAEAHRHGLVHRDVKPSNLFLVGGDVAKVTLLDFGIARPSDAETVLTASGLTVGTPAYMAPEQVLGERTIDARADIFSLGCVLFQCLSGQPPSVGADGRVAPLRLTVRDAPRVRSVRADVPPELDALLARMLARAPDARPADGGALEIALGMLRSVEGAEPAPLGITSEERRAAWIVWVVLPEAARDEASREELQAIAGVHGGQGAVLESGELVVHFASDDGTSEPTVQAARCALAVGQRWSAARIALACGAARSVEGRATGELVARVRDLARRAPPDDDAAAIRLDATAAGLLGYRFDLARTKSGLFLRGERDARPSTGDGPESGTYVGRERELALLEGAFAECSADAAARAVLVTAPAGVGKTRLIAELLRRLTERGADPVVVAGRSDVMSAGSAFAPIAGAIRGWVGIHARRAPAAERAALRDAIAPYVDGADLERVVLFLGELANVRFPDDASPALRAARSDAILMGDALRQAWETWLGALTRQRSVVLVLDDLHWGDIPTIRFLDIALERLAERPLFVLATARPEVHGQFPALWRGRAVQEVVLAPLGARASERLARELLGAGAGEDVVRSVVERAEGNPFHVEELARAVATGAASEIPDTVLGLVQARLDALGPRAKRVLRAASVFGLRFRTAGVACVLGANDAEGAGVEEALRELHARGVLRARRAPGEGEHEFHHALVRDAAYATLTDEDRALAHGLAGHWLEDSGEHDPTVLAEHFERAAQPALAARWYRRAAEVTFEGGDLRGAIERAERALACAPDHEARAWLRILQSEAHYALAELERAVETATDAHAWAPRGSVTWFRAIGSAIAAAGQRGHNDRVEHWLKEAVAAEPAEAARGAQLVALSRGVGHLVMAGREDAAKAASDKLEAVAAAVELPPETRTWLHRARSAPLMRGARYESLFREQRMMLDLLEQVGDTRNACYARLAIGSASAVVGLFRHAEAELLRARSAAERLGAGYYRSWASYGLGKVAALRGDAPAARAILEDVIERLPDSTRIVAGAHVYLSLSAHRAGDFQRAADDATRALARPLADPMRAAASAALARARLALGEIAEARAHAEAAATILGLLGKIEEFDGLVRLAHAETLHAAGEEQRAREVIADAARRIEETAQDMSDPELRGSFLEALDIHVRTLALARAWCRAPA